MRIGPRIQVHGVQGNGWKWATVLHSHDGRACPRCGALVIGSNHRAQHVTEHGRRDALEEAVRELAEAVRRLAIDTGHGDWYGVGERPELDEYAADTPAAADGYVIGSGELPPETRGGDES